MDKFLGNLVLILTLASWVYLLAQTASAQKQSPPQQSLTKQSPRQPTNPRGPGVPGGGQVRPPRNPRGPGVPGGGNLYEDILNGLREENSIGVRGGNLCAIAPPARLANTTNGIWHSSPIFIWQGEAQRIELLVSGSDEVLWSKNLQNSDRIAVYEGEPLEPGRRYEWRLYSSEEDFLEVLFRILPREERASITAELTALENQLQANNATEEQIALARANYFAGRRLWADALQEIYRVKNPSEQLKKLGQEITTYICNVSPSPN